MRTSYENQREVFSQIIEQYKSYLKLYRFLNHGKTSGATPFHLFYWNKTFYSQHDTEFRFERD